MCVALTAEHRLYTLMSELLLSFALSVRTPLMVSVLVVCGALCSCTVLKKYELEPELVHKHIAVALACFPKRVKFSSFSTMQLTLLSALCVGLS